ncbi:tyrosine-type recombinase/integrase [Sphingobium sp. Cam5-1]|uniref:tyrosine-type recombinase/integrase n=1 Tax=Sphingobium sp. Cam5-1 TaxID=2789327 RepID=UPI0018AD2C2B|nr:tyrosine-type recombinase/integrase [Sphingobium sp. Cam5-1]QPI73400.1 tyrosine-type recombinase/integrase [Sphingobium sp. Cam5-1]QPI75543.1 tyrosine-type recombinase/integrase [Sphingobium sp. Cam5-1]QPI75714.1 tyrosine-type recombinase/integrase [Sphingobium sp. Cam5-1]
MPKDLSSSLNRHIDTFIALLTAKNYKPQTIAAYRNLLQRLVSSIEAAGISPRDLTVEQAADLVRGDERNRREPNKCQNIARRFVVHLIDSGVAPTPVRTPEQIAREALRLDYEDYLVRQRGVSRSSVYSAWRFADRFLDHRFGEGETDLAAISQADAVAFLEHLLGRKAPYRDKSAASHLRTFLQYLFQRGVTQTNLASGVPMVAQRWDARLPRFLSPEQIDALLAWVRDNPKHGLRDYAMLMLMARLGLRAPEVIAIRLEDIDWRAGELLVRGKGQRHDRLPVPADVGEALARYIRNERVSASRTLFVSLRAPNLPFKGGQIINAILKEAFAATGTKPPAPYVGSHVLRHSLATNMIRSGASLAEIGDMLRHRSRVSTMIYAKLDIDGLRSIAKPWPVAGEAQ